MKKGLKIAGIITALIAWTVMVSFSSKRVAEHLGNKLAEIIED